MDDEDERFMRAALALSRRNLGRTMPNPCVGALVVKDGAIVGRGVTAPGGRPHAERIALAQAGSACRDATLYVTLEPCAHRSRGGDGGSCTDAILTAGVGRVVIAAEDPSPFASGEGVARLSASGVVLRTGVLAAEAHALNRGHALRVTARRPRVLLKLARTADGFVARLGGRPLAITGAAAQTRVHLMRSETDAILVGVGTALADDPLLTCRLPGLEARSPIRVVLDSQLRLPPGAQLARTARRTPTWVLCGTNASAERETALRGQGVEVLRAAMRDGRLDLPDALRRLADWGVTRLMVEGGPAVAEAFAAGGVIDAVALFTAPKLIGQGLSALGSALASVIEGGLPLQRETRVGEDLLQEFEAI